MHRTVACISLVTFGLMIIDYLLSQKYWFFSANALITWSIANFIYAFFEAREWSKEPWEFLFYCGVIICASGLAAVGVAHLMPIFGFGSQHSTNPSYIQFFLVLGYSLVASVIAYILPKIPLTTIEYPGT